MKKEKVQNAPRGQNPHRLPLNARRTKSTVFIGTKKLLLLESFIILQGQLLDILLKTAGSWEPF